jgi:hypothetical protein
VLDLEFDFHAKLCSLLDGEGFGLESLQLARLAQVDNDIWATFDLEKVRVVFASFLGSVIPQDPVRE